MKSISGFKLLMLGILIGILGVAPLELYSVFGAKDGNPVGLGLLYVVAKPLSVFVIVLALIKMMIEMFIKSKDSNV